MDGQESVGNSLGRAPLGGSDTSDGREEPWEIAWGELHSEGATLQRRQGGRMGNRGK